MNQEIIQKGTVLELDSKFFIDEEYNVYAMGFKVGYIPLDRLTWFDQSIKPKPKEIKNIIFIEDGIFSIRELVDIIEEYNLLSLQDKEQVLYSATNKLSEITEQGLK